MEDKQCMPAKGPGRYLCKGGGRHRVAPGRCLTVAVLLIWDGLLLYMIMGCLIDPVYGAVFVAVVSVYLGYLL